MPQRAHLTSIEALRQLQTALQEFEFSTRESLTMFALEIRRALEWFEQDRRRYWAEQVRRSSQQVVEARNALERCQLRFGSEEAPSCYEQKQALLKARRRLQVCEEKVRLTRHWIPLVRQAADEFEGQSARLGSYLDAELPQATATLQRLLAAVERYVSAGTSPDRGGRPPPEVDPAAEGGVQ